MVENMLHRYTVFFVACALPLLITGQIAPNMAYQLDFWLMWLLAMVLVGLPVLFAELALSARSAALPWQGIQKLTREADAGMIWRAFAALSVLVAVLLAAGIASRIAVGVAAQFGELVRQAGVPMMAMSAVVMAVALILSLLRVRLLFVGTLLVIFGAMLSLFDSAVSVPLLTEPSLGEWSQAVLLALLSVGAGSGLYWFGSATIANNVMQAKKPLAGYILPIWLTQLIFGALAILAGSAMIGVPSFLVSSVGMLLIAAFLLHYAGVQLVLRFGLLTGVLVLVLLVFALSVVPMQFLVIVVIFISLLAVLCLAIFSGFVMKISHLRKTFNMKTELRYNIWRVLVRIIVPLAVVAALAGVVLELVA
ncbi:hypothetical protein SAMN02745664_10184 [Moraxella cuniculi DSM 21768]|uniref:Uncharacterized protein n=2 Tax=Moraxella cuniculi TaxID=34061 RepID=A0A1N7D8S3_9GAMM|nr:hypothetical protein SAMN02745664_10184 [Moraxella cuniculi DSM 21768]